jgi:hypothetical protein
MRDIPGIWHPSIFVIALSSHGNGHCFLTGHQAFRPMLVMERPFSLKIEPQHAFRLGDDRITGITL